MNEPLYPKAKVDLASRQAQAAWEQASRQRWRAQQLPLEEAS